MRIYKNLYEAVKETQRDLHEMGTTVRLKTYQNIDVSQDESHNTTKEITGHTFRVLDPLEQRGITDAYSMLYVDNEKISKLKEWVEMEFIERIFWGGEINPGEAWKIREEIWKDLFSKDNNGKFDYTYNERFFEKNQLWKVIETLTENLYSRRCVLQVFQYDKDIEAIGKLKRVPCSVDYSWLYRDDKLNIFYHMRSCDFYNHFLNDMILAAKLNRWVAYQIKVEPGDLVVYINSLHAYKAELDERQIF